VIRRPVEKNHLSCRFGRNPVVEALSDPTDFPNWRKTMAQYLILIYENEAGYVDVPQDAWQQMMDAHGRLMEQVKEKGSRIISSEALQPTSTATSIRDDIVTDGPFTETKEALGGYYLIEANDLDHALDIAKLCPAPFGGVEVRPIMDLSAGR
jgi:hypothetical protein